MKRTSLLFATLLLVPTLSFAQERTASSGLEMQASWTALKSLVEQANGNAKIAKIGVDAIIACNEKKMLYAPNNAARDAGGCIKVVDPQKLDMQTGTFDYSGGVGCGSGAHVCGSDNTTAKKVCQTLGYNSATGVGTASYKSPKDNWIGRWTGSGWSVYNARQNNVYMRSITCLKFTYE